MTMATMTRLLLLFTCSVTFPADGIGVTVTPGPGNVTIGPGIGNVTGTPTPSAGNVTEQVSNSNNLAVMAIVILALLIVGFVAWDRWRAKK
jgi:hypothetical protein